MLKRTFEFFVNLYFRFFRGRTSLELHNFKSNTLYDPGLIKYLTEFQKPGIKHDLDLGRFYVMCIFGYGYHYNISSNIYSDTNYMMVLAYKEAGSLKKKGVACIGFDVVDSSTIIVRQIQGVRGESSIIKNFRWEKMLLQILMIWAKNAGFKLMKVIQGKSSLWYNQDRDYNFFMKYDVTARRSGFKFDEKDKTYVRVLV